ncbi:MAG: sensor histidine kinase [Actinobacteria bacterium]|nr:sensor histidine kinase [Actinomycetota bacterium]
MKARWSKVSERRESWLDPLLAASLFVLTTVNILPTDIAPSEMTLAMLGGAVGTLPLAWRRRAPLVVHAAVVGGNALTVLSVEHVNLPGLLVAWVFSGYSVAAHAHGWRAIAGLVLQAVPVVGFAEVQPAGSDAVGPAQVLLMLVPWLAGKAVRERRIEAAALEEKNRQLESESSSRAALAAAEERARIAREVHDVVAHSVSVMVVQAEAGDALLQSDPSEARRSLRSIQGTGRVALSELRHALGVLKSDADKSEDLEPQPSLERIPDLINEMTKLGLEIDLKMEGRPRPLPPAADLSTYRIVQEALTNTLKHAGPVATTVRLCFEPTALLVEVTDVGGGGGVSHRGHGQGLVGMRERVALCGGELHAGPRDSGGFVVRARLPLGDEP